MLFVTVVISNCAFISKLFTTLFADPSENVTKSPTSAPCPLSVTVTVALLFAVVKGLVNVPLVLLIGVTSKATPSV